MGPALHHHHVRHHQEPEQPVLRVLLQALRLQGELSPAVSWDC